MALRKPCSWCARTAGHRPNCPRPDEVFTVDDLNAARAEAARAPDGLAGDAMWAYQFVGALSTVYDFPDDDIVPLLDHLSAMSFGQPTGNDGPAVPGSVARQATLERAALTSDSEPVGPDR